MIWLTSWTWNLGHCSEIESSSSCQRIWKQEGLMLRPRVQNASPLIAHTTNTSFNSIRKQGFIVPCPRLVIFYIRLSPPGRTRRNEQLSVQLWTRRCHSLQIGAHWHMQSFHVKFGLEPAWYTLWNHFNLLFKFALISLALSHSSCQPECTLRWCRLDLPAGFVDQSWTCGCLAFHSLPVSLKAALAFQRIHLNEILV